MNHRRRTLLAATAALVSAGTRAGIIDWYNGVELRAKLPAHDAEYLTAAPPASFRLRLIDFWATWCAPCREEFPHLNELHQLYAPQGLSVVGLSMESAAIVRPFLQKVSITYPVGAGGKQPLQAQLGIKALPYAVIVDHRSVIVWRGQTSSLTSAELETLLAAAA